MIVTWSDDIGRVARQRRKDLNLSQSALAERAGVTRQWLSRFEQATAEVSLSKALVVLRELQLVIDLSPAEARRTTPLATSRQSAQHERAQDLIAPMRAALASMSIPTIDTGGVRTLIQSFNTQTLSTLSSNAAPSLRRAIESANDALEGSDAQD